MSFYRIQAPTILVKGMYRPCRFLRAEWVCATVHSCIGAFPIYDIVDCQLQEWTQNPTGDIDENVEPATDLGSLDSLNRGTPPSWIFDDVREDWYAEFTIPRCCDCNALLNLQYVGFGLPMSSLHRAATELDLHPQELRKQIENSEDPGAYLKLSARSEWVCPEYAPLRDKLAAQRAAEPKGIVQGEMEQPYQGDKAEFAE